MSTFPVIISLTDRNNKPIIVDEAEGGDALSGRRWYSAIEHLASALCLSDYDPMALMTAYFDDSGTHLESTIAVAACVVSDVRRWKQFEWAWLVVLEDAGISNVGFHMADFVAHKPPFDDWSANKRDQVIKALIEIINKYVLGGMVTAVYKQDYDRFVSGRLREKLGTSHYTFAVQSCLAHIEAWMIDTSVAQPMQYVFDWMEKGNGKHEIIDLFDDIAASNVAVNFGIEPKGYAFQHRKHIVPLQSADILAWEAYRYMRDHHFTGKAARQSFQSMVDGVGLRTRFFDAGSLPKLVSDVTAKYEALDWKGPLGGFLPEL
jgi:hypothetical protein